MAPLKWKAITNQLMDTGACRGEILGLKPENVNYEEGFVIIDHANATTTAMIYAHQISIAKINAANVRAGIFAKRSGKSKKKRA